MASSKSKVRAWLVRNPATVDVAAAHDLALYIRNDSYLWTKRMPDFARSIAAKILRGKYDRALAVKLIGYLVKEGAAKYRKEHGGPPFDPATRVQASVELLEYVEGFVRDGQF